MPDPNKSPSTVTCLLDLDGVDGRNKPALPTNTFINGFLQYMHSQEKAMERENAYQYYYCKSKLMKMLLATSTLKVSVVKCRKILTDMILNNDEIVNAHGLALNHMSLVDGIFLPGKYTWRNYNNSTRSVEFKMCFADPKDWIGLQRRHYDRPIDLILLGYVVELKPIDCCWMQQYHCPLHDDKEVFEESYGMTFREWQVTKYVKLVLQGLRALMESVLVDDYDQFEDVLGTFGHLCAEAVAQHGYIQAVEMIRLYASCFLECTLSSGSYYMLVLANKCGHCKDCKLIIKSHESLFTRPQFQQLKQYKELLEASPLVDRDKITKLSFQADQSFEAYRETTKDPNQIPIVSYLRAADKSLKCGDIRDILKAGMLQKSYQLFGDNAKSPTFYLGTIHYDAQSRISKFHRNRYRHALGISQTSGAMKKALQLAGEYDLITLRVNEDIFVYAIDRKTEDDLITWSNTPQIILDGKDMVTLLRAVQLGGGSTIYSNINFGAFSYAKFTGHKTLWIPPLAEDLLQAGVYASIYGENDELAVCNVVEQAMSMEGKYSYRSQKEALHILKAKRINADIYQCLDDHAKLTRSRAKGVRLGYDEVNYNDIL
jgi:hypothetical protein